jgi:hypothetical protein
VQSLLVEKMREVPAVKGCEIVYHVQQAARSEIRKG